MRNIKIAAKYVTFSPKKGSNGVAPYQRIQNTAMNREVLRNWRRQQKAQKIEVTPSNVNFDKPRLVKKGTSNWIGNLYEQ